MMQPETKSKCQTHEAVGSTIKIVATGFGDPEVLEVVNVQRPSPRRNEVTIAVRAAGVNRRDYKSYSDRSYATARGRQPTFPMPLGVEASGVVMDVGNEAVGPVGRIVVGDEVIAYRVTGAYAGFIVVSADDVIPKPVQFSWEQAATMMLTGTTAAHVLAAIRARRGQTVLVHGAGGGVGLAALQLARLDDINVIGTAGHHDFDELRRFGATPVAYGGGLLESVRKLAPHGVDAAIDLVGTDEAIDVSLALVADRTRIATIVAFERAKQVGIQALGGSDGEDRTGIDIRNNARLRLTALVQADRYDVKVSRTFPLAEAAQAHRLLASGGGGRIALVVSDH